MEMIDLSLHMPCSVEQNIKCSNSIFSSGTIYRMHETAKRLLEAGLSAGEKDFTSIAKRLGASDQSATNWKARGVPKAKLILAVETFGVSLQWLTKGFGDMWQTPPTKTCSVVSMVAATPPDSDEIILIRGYRMADDTGKKMLITLAKEAIKDFNKRSGAK